MKDYNKLVEKIQKAQPKRIWVFPHIGEKTRDPIRLEDVLVAIRNLKYKSGENAFWLFDITTSKIRNAWSKLEISWELNTPLHLQSDETKKMLINLIVK